MTPPKARTMESAASAHWRRQDSISAAPGEAELECGQSTLGADPQAAATALNRATPKAASVLSAVVFPLFKLSL